MAPAPRDGRVSATLAVREELPRPAAERATAVGDSLRELVESGVLDDFATREWPKRVPIDGCDTDVRDAYLAYSSWASDAGVSLAPFFATRECYSAEAGRHTDWLVVPAFALAIRVDGDLAAVYPHSDGSETATVEDGIERLRSGAVSPAGVDPVEVSPHSTGANR